MIANDTDIGVREPRMIGWRIGNRVDIDAYNIASGIVLAQRLGRVSRRMNDRDRMVGIEFLDDVVSPDQGL